MISYHSSILQRRYPSNKNLQNARSNANASTHTKKYLFGVFPVYAQAVERLDRSQKSDNYHNTMYSLSINKIQGGNDARE